MFRYLALRVFAVVISTVLILPVFSNKPAQAYTITGGLGQQKMIY